MPSFLDFSFSTPRLLSVDLATVKAIRPELEAELVGCRLGKVFQLSKLDIAIDFRLSGSKYLFISVEPGNPRTYLIKRRLRDLEKTSGNPSPFALVLKKNLTDGEVTSIDQLPNERVLFFRFDRSDELNGNSVFTVAAQLTGSSANLFLLDAELNIVESLRRTDGYGQQAGDRYEPPARIHDARREAGFGLTKTHGTISESLDAADLEKTEARRFQTLANNARSKIKNEISRRRKLIGKLREDLVGHGNAVEWKRMGDLLLANASTARRDRSKVWLTDYFNEAAPEINVEIDENDSLTEAAEKFFKRYTKARNAEKQISERLLVIENELASLEVERAKLEELIESGDEQALAEFAGGEKNIAKDRRPQRSGELSSGTRTFVSTDGFEILVGKKAKDNDFLTFRLARSLDTWMHAADYPGSHVVIRNPNRKQIPHSTLIEAAQLAAFYSQGKAQPKAAVHYTQKKFVNKPKGAAPGLVSLASFKTILVEPKIGEATLKTQ